MRHQVHIELSKEEVLAALKEVIKAEQHALLFNRSLPYDKYEQYSRVVELTRSYENLTKLLNCGTPLYDRPASSHAS